MVGNLIRGLLPAMAVAVVMAWAGPAAGDAAPAPEVEALRQQVQLLQQQVDALNKRLDELQTAPPPAPALPAAEAKPEAAAKPAEAGKPAPAKVSFDHEGLKISSGDKKHELRLGTVIAYDWAWFTQDHELKLAVGDEQDGTGFGLARLKVQAKLWEHFASQIELEFAGQNGQDTPRFLDVYIEYRDIPYGGDRAFALRAGHFKEPFSLEELTSDALLTLPVRALPNVFSPRRNAGIQIQDAWFGEPGKERMTATLGVFKETDDWPSSNDSDENQGYQVTTRVTGLPWYAEGGKRLLHLGAAYSRRNPNGAVLAYGLRPSTRLGLFQYVDPDKLPAPFRLRDAWADDVNLYGAEMALVTGPFSLQAEYMRSNVHTELGGTLDLQGYYAMASVFLTGEHRNYRHAIGSFDRVIPKRGIQIRGEEGRGPGAWELVARYAAVDLDDQWLRGGVHTAYDAGLNWYLNPNVRVDLNYSYNVVDHDLYAGDFSYFQTRFQLDF